MTTPDETGVPYRKVLEALLERTKREDRRAKLLAELEAPPFPDAAAGIWRDFHEIAAGASVTPMGALRITWGDLDAWSRLTGSAPPAWEVRLIMRLGDELQRAGQSAEADG